MRQPVVVPKFWDCTHLIVPASAIAIAALIALQRYVDGDVT
jgi:hypothetical protein